MVAKIDRLLFAFESLLISSAVRVHQEFWSAFRLFWTALLWLLRKHLALIAARLTVGFVESSEGSPTAVGVIVWRRSASASRRLPKVLSSSAGTPDAHHQFRTIDGHLVLLCVLSKR